MPPARLRSGSGHHTSCSPRGFARGPARACSGGCTHNPSSLSALAVKLRGLTTPRVSHRCQRNHATRATPLATSPYPDRGTAQGIAHQDRPASLTHLSSLDSRPPTASSQRDHVSPDATKHHHHAPHYTIPTPTLGTAHGIALQRALTGSWLQSGHSWACPSPPSRR